MNCIKVQEQVSAGTLFCTPKNFVFGPKLAQLMHNLLCSSLSCTYLWYYLSENPGFLQCIFHFETSQWRAAEKHVFIQLFNICMNCWETFHIQISYRHNILISEQQVNDINHLYELADTSRIPLQALWLSPALHSAQYTRHTGVSSTYLRIYLHTSC